VVNILVTGASGMIGGQLVQQLALRPDLRIRACHRSALADTSPIGGIEWVRGNLLSASFADEICKDIDLVYHLAHPTVPSSSFLPEWPAATSGAIQASLNLIDALSRSRQPRRIIFLSTGGAMYGDQHRPGGFREDAEPLPTCAYAIEKLAIEHHIRIAARSGLLRAIVLRAANVYGKLLPVEHRQGFIGAALAQALKRSPVGIFGSLDNVRDYVHVEDVTAALLCCCEIDPVYEIFNLGTGHGTSVREVLRMVETRLGLTLALKDFPIPKGPGLPAWSILNANKFKLATGWRPTIGLAEGIDGMIQSASYRRRPISTEAGTQSRAA
jgi:UDP-glucose 4-epimerase